MAWMQLCERRDCGWAY